MFITCLCGILDTGRHRFDFANAGHCPPILYGGSAAPRFTPVGGKALGMFPSSILQDSLRLDGLEIEPGRGLLIYSDGLTEAMNDARQQLGEDEVLRALATATEDAPAALRTLRALVSRHRGEAGAADDLTLFLFSRKTAPAPAVSTVTSVEEIFR
jgi:sigma-B regulation protein RsbU (phosphoserine phosphatase)